MATVKRVNKNGRTVWRVHWKNPEKPNRPYTQSFFRSEGAARAFAADKAADTLSPSDLWAEASLTERADAMEALRLARKSGVSVAEAVRLVVSRSSSPLPVGELVARVVEEKRRRGIRPRSLSGLSRDLREFAASVGWDTQAGEVSPEDVSAFLTRPTWGAARRRGALISVSAAYNLAARQGWLRENPAARVERPVVEPSETSVLSAVDATRLFRWLEEEDPELLGFAALCAFAGFRPESEAARTSRETITRGLATGWLPSPTANKTRRRRVVPVLPALHAWLAAWLPLGAEVCPRNFQRRWRVARVSSGLGDWPQDVLRHSWVTYRLASTQDDARTAVEAGHTQEELHRSYKALATSGEAAEWWGILPLSPDLSPAARRRAEAVSTSCRERMSGLARARHARRTLAHDTLAILRGMPDGWAMPAAVAEVSEKTGRDRESVRNSIRALIRSGDVWRQGKAPAFRHGADRKETDAGPGPG